MNKNANSDYVRCLTRATQKAGKSLVYAASFSDQITNKPVKKSSLKQITGAKSLLY